MSFDVLKSPHVTEVIKEVLLSLENTNDVRDGSVTGSFAPCSTFELSPQHASLKVSLHILLQ